jgi:uncharacterized integral membrane protein
MRTWIKAALGAATALAAFVLFFHGRHWPVGQAALVAIAVGALVFTTLGTSERLRGIYRRQGRWTIRKGDD